MAAAGKALFTFLVSSPTIVSGFIRSSAPALHHDRLRAITTTMTTSESEGGANTYIDKLALILISKDKRQLVARSKGKSVFYTPGGKREGNENDAEALLRECQEELAVHLIQCVGTPTASIEQYGTFEAQAYGKPEGTMVRMSCYRVRPSEAERELEGLVRPSSEIEELAWIDSTFDRDRLTVTGVMILDDLKEKGLIN